MVSLPASFGVVALLLALVPIHPRTQDQAALDAIVAEHVRGAEAMPVDEIWTASQALRDAVESDDAPGLDAALDRSLTRSGASEHARLLLAAARLSGGEPDRDAIASVLLELLRSNDEAVSASAANLLAEREFKEIKGELHDRVLTELGQRTRDATHAPEFRLQAATALHVLGGGDEQREARHAMMEFLGSSDPKLRALGALALARIGDLETGLTELQRVAKQPGEAGRLAEAYLKQEDIRRLYERQKKNAMDYARQKVGETDLKNLKDLALVEKVIRLIETTSLTGDKVQRDKLISAALDGMLHSLDEHSSYMTPKIYKQFDQDLLQPEYGGIGAYVGEDPEDKLFTIRQPIYSGPAYRAGLHTDDKIVRIDDWPTLGPNGSHPVDEIIKRLKGKPGTKVKLYVWRHGMDVGLIDRPTEEMSVTIEREEIKIPPVKSQMLPGKIALVELQQFTRVASEELASRLADLKAQGMRGVILDLRGNTGGLLTEACNVANLFLPKKSLVVTTESRVEEPEKLYTRNEPLISADMPVAVLINRYSASASEIVAGALQDYQRATLVGQRSFGKGSVQQLLPIPGERDDEFVDENKNGRFDSWEKLTKDYNGNGEFDFAPRARMTIARYLLPSGRSIHREFDENDVLVSEGGVTPEEKVELPRLEPWKVDELRKLQRDHKLRDYVEREMPKNRDLFVKLAQGDNDDTTQYPEFDSLYNSLGTTLTPQDVRMMLRREIRGKAQDVVGAAFPDGDYEEDTQLQAAIRVVMQAFGGTPDSVEAYARTFDAAIEGGKDKTANRLLTANLSDVARSDLRHALTLIDEGKSGGGLSPERLKELERVLQAVLDN